MKRLTQMSGMAFAILFAMFVSSVGADGRKLEGTWDAILLFPEATCNRPECGCPGGMPNIPIPTVNTFLKHGGMLWTSKTTLFVGPGQGRWEHLGHNRFEAHFQFAIFNLATGFSTASEDVTQTIHLTGRDTYTGNMTYDLLDAAGNLVAEDCRVKIDSATRFE